METAAKHKPNLEILSDPHNLAHRCVELYVADVLKAVEKKGCFCAAISGGNTPRAFFEMLGHSEQARSLPWDKIHLFWVDERCVPPDSRWSNYKLAADTFLTKVAIPQSNVHRIPTEQADSNSVALCYEQTIRSICGATQRQIPQLDLIILGMGADGHTGSLFPNSYAAFDTEDLACAVYVLDEKLNRITLTHPVLKAASHLVVLVSGGEKAAILQEVFNSEPDEVRYPIHMLWPVLDKITWLVDREAAGAI